MTSMLRGIHGFLGFMFCLVGPYVVGSFEVSHDRLHESIGGVDLCNIRDGFQFQYTNCTGGSLCTGEWRHQATDLDFFPRIHLYEMEDHCDNNPSCNPQQSFNKTGSAQDGTCVRMEPVPIP